MDKTYDQNHLEARTGEAAELVARDMVHFMWQGVEYQLDICMVHMWKLIMFKTI